MPASTELGVFLEKVMRINVLKMGGASGGIAGSISGDHLTLQDLKKSAITFAKEYIKPEPDKDELLRLSEEINGYFRILQLTYTLSEKEADKLMDELQALVDEA